MQRVVKSFSFIVPFLIAVCVSAAPTNLLKNGSFETRDAVDSTLPEFWTEKHEGSEPLQFTGEHYDGAAGALLVGDGKTHLWRQNILKPTARQFTVSAWVKADDVAFQNVDDFATLYVHILYKDKPYAAATHLPCKLEPGTYGWRKVTASAIANNPADIALLHVSVTGKFSAGRYAIDQVEVSDAEALKPEALLARKIDDLSTSLARVENLDASVAVAAGLLKSASEHLQQSPPKIDLARSDWVAAAKAVSPAVWKKLYPDAMSDAPVEAQMLYHAGLGQSAAACDESFDLLALMGGNATYQSLGSWMGVVHHSRKLNIEPGWESFDALKFSIESAKRRGFKSFAYIAALYGTSTPPTGPESLYTKHPEWFAKPGPDKNMPTFPDPANPEVADFIVNLYVELATTYDLDGIGLDYIRYPTETALNFDERNRQEILKRYNIDIFEGDVTRDPAKWAKIREYRAAVVGNLVHRVRDAVKQAKPGISVMACLISEPDDCYKYGQNWPVSSKWLDYATPMNYDDRCLNEPMLADQRRIFAENKTVYIPALGGMPEVHEQWTISEWARRIAIQRRIGCDGIIVYRHNGFDPAVAAFFGNGPFHTPAKFPPAMK